MGGLCGRIRDGNVREIVLGDGVDCPCICAEVSYGVLHLLTYTRVKGGEDGLSDADVNVDNND